MPLACASASNQPCLPTRTTVDDFRRTHRERKEQYARELEFEVLRLKQLLHEVFAEKHAAVSARDEALKQRDELIAENSQLRQALQQSSAGLPVARHVPALSLQSGMSSGLGVAADSGAPLKSELTSRQTSIMDVMETQVLPSRVPQNEEFRHQAFVSTGPQQLDDQITRSPLKGKGRIDYDALGLDFILTLERPCMHHMQYLNIRAHNPTALVADDGMLTAEPLDVPDDGEMQHLSGHALMSTAPSLRQIIDEPSTFHHPHLPTLQRGDLERLLNLSQRLNVQEVELPPVRAWTRIVEDQRTERLGLTIEQFGSVKAALLPKVRCYRFGAVVTEQDVAGALDSVFRPQPPI